MVLSRSSTAEDNRKWDAQPGPAQPFLGFGIVDYKRLMLTAEGWVFEGGVWQKVARDDTMAAGRIVVSEFGGLALEKIALVTGVRDRARFAAKL